MDKISLKAPAKINLYLKVLGKRQDGYHEIESLMQAISLYDEISLEQSDLLELECDDPSIPSNEDNLALRAAILLKERTYFPGVKISLKKNIPVGSGLGGGSSDAAFVIRGVSDLFSLRLTSAEKMELAAEIGSDVPFFLSTGQAIVSGRGERISVIKIPTDYRIVVLIPPRGISTAEVYARLKNSLTKDNESVLFKREISSSSFYRLMRSFSNDLEDAALADLPELLEIKKILIESGCIYSSLTGSGSALFGVYLSSRTDRSRLETRFGRDYRIYFCSPILLPPF